MSEQTIESRPTGAIQCPKAQEIFLAGLELAEDRPLNPNEIAEMYEDVLGWKNLAKIALFISISVLTLCATSFSVLPLVSLLKGFIPLEIILFVGCATLYWPAYRLERAIKSNRVQVFQGVAANLPADKYQSYLRSKVKLKSIKEIKYLPSIRMAWSVSGRTAPAFLFKHERPVCLAAGPQTRDNHGMDPEERIELRRHRNTYVVRTLCQAPCVSVWCFVVSSISIHDIQTIPITSKNFQDVVFLLVILIMWSPYKLLRSLRLTIQLGGDLRSGKLDVPQPGEETLRRSRLLWRRDGRPAAWRASRPPYFIGALPDAASYQAATGVGAEQ